MNKLNVIIFSLLFSLHCYAEPTYYFIFGDDLAKNAVIVNKDGYKTSSIFGSCKEILSNGYSHGNDTYIIQKNGEAKSVFCEMSIDGGGWLKLIDISNYKEGVSEDTIDDQNYNYSEVLFVVTDENHSSDYFESNDSYWRSYGFASDRFLLNTNMGFYALKFGEENEYRGCATAGIFKELPFNIIKQSPKRFCHRSKENHPEFCSNILKIPMLDGMRITGKTDVESQYGCNTDNWFKNHYAVYIR